MALIFCRPNFSSGITIVREPVPVLDESGKHLEEDGKKLYREKVYLFKRNDLNKPAEFFDEKYILERYPVLFKKA